MAFEHQIKIPCLCQITAAASWAELFAIFFWELICAVAGIARFAVHHRIAESFLVPRGFPDRPVHDDRAIHPFHVIALAHIAPPPEIFEIFLQLHAKWTVVPEAVQATVDFGGLENEPPSLAQAHNFFHSGGRNIFGHRREMKPESRVGVNAAVIPAFSRAKNFIHHASCALYFSVYRDTLCLS